MHLIFVLILCIRQVVLVSLIKIIDLATVVDGQESRIGDAYKTGNSIMN